MNAEIIKIRNERDLGEKFDTKPIRINEEEMTGIIIKLNQNIADVYMMIRQNNIDTDEIINKFITNIYIILDAFNKMNVYPDYFYNEIVKMNVDYKKIANDNSVRGQYNIFHNTGLNAKTIEEIKDGLKEERYSYQTPNYDIGDAYNKMQEFFELFKIPHGTCTKEQCAKSYIDIENNLRNIMGELETSDDIFDDIACLSRLLFDYMTFFVGIGVNPKNQLEEYINKEEHQRKI